MKDLKVLQINAEAGTEQYRVFNVAEQLEIAGCDHRILALGELAADLDRARGILREHDLIILHRVAYDRFLLDMCDDARSHGALIAYETDDLTFFPGLDPAWIDGLRYLAPDEILLYFEGIERYQKLMLACDVGIFSTRLLAALASRLGLPSWVLKNALGRPFLKTAAAAYNRRRRAGSQREKVRLGYCSGTRTHDKDFAEFSAVLLRLLEEIPSLELAILGPLALPPAFDRFARRIRHHDPVPWPEVPGILAGFDVNLAPLEPRNPFCRCKSELKYFEAGAVGVPTVATRIDEFEAAIEHGDNGFLVSGDGELEACLRDLIAQPALRHDVGEAAREHVLDHYTPEARARDLSLILEEMQSSAARSRDRVAP